MKKLLLFLLAGGLVLAGVANAAPVVRTANLQLTVTIQGLPGVVVSGTGTVLVDTAAQSLSIAAGQIVQTAPITIPVTATTAIASVKAIGIDNFSGTFFPGGQLVSGSIMTELPCPSATPIATGVGCVGGIGVGGQMGLSGTVFAVIVPMLVTVPIPMPVAGIGVGGFARVPNSAAGFLIDAAPWTNVIGKVGYLATSTYITLVPGVHFAMSPTGSTYAKTTNSWSTTAVTLGSGTLAVTPPLGGQITLVSPTYVSALGNLLPVFSTLVITFPIPEPGTLLLLGTGIGGLVLLGRRRR